MTHEMLDQIKSASNRNSGFLNFSWERFVRAMRCDLRCCAIYACLFRMRPAADGPLLKSIRSVERPERFSASLTIDI